MAEAEGVSAILHLSAFVAVFALAFLGYDRATDESSKSALETTAVRSEEALDVARKRMIEAGLQELHPSVRPSNIGAWASLFALAAIAKLPLRWPPVWTAVFSVTNVFKLSPLMLVRSGWHERIVFICAVAVCTVLFGYGWAAVSGAHWAAEPQVLTWAYRVNLAAFLIILAMSAAVRSVSARRLKRLVASLQAAFPHRVSRGE